METFINRLKKIGIAVELFGNYPWIYLDKVNGNKVLEKYNANHGFNIAYYGKSGDVVFESDLRKIFEIIRKYK